MQRHELKNADIYSGYNLIGNCSTFSWKCQSETGLPCHFSIAGLNCEYDMEALLVRKDIYLRAGEKEYIAKNFQIEGVSDLVTGTAQSIELLFEKFPEMKSMTDGEKVVISKETQSETLKALTGIIEAIKFSKSFELLDIKEAAKKIVSDIQESEGAILNLMELRSFSGYHLTHNYNVGILSAYIGSALKLHEKALLEVTIGALLHDMGKLKIADTIISKDSKLSDEEFEEMKQHPRYGYEIFKDNPDIPAASKTLILQHHEKYDGSGYPESLKDIEISLYAQICSLADVFDALTSERPYRVAKTPYEAVRILNSMVNTAFSPEVLQAFIRKTSLYPPGSLVRLNDDSIALILRNNQTSLIRPEIKLIADKAGRRIKERKIFDLAKENKLYIKSYAVPSDLNVTIR